MHIVHNNIGMNTAYVSGPGARTYERLVTKQARAARTSKSDLVARYVIEKSVETEYPGHLLQGLAFRTRSVPDWSPCGSLGGGQRPR